MEKVRVCWRSIYTGAMGRSEPIARFLADAWLEHLAPLRPDIGYWLEDVPTPSNSTKEAATEHPPTPKGRGKE